mmetsp:Transcript_22824/g.77044  ORF Transcript_22824/g.77044 Transcript_22824/m.77044 type:complete len:304 (+) Transcript_22824:351-1262(+)
MVASSSAPPPRSGSCAGSCAGEAVERGGEALLAARPAAGEAGRCPRTTPLPPAAAAARRCRIPKGRAVGGCSARAPSLGLRAAAASAAAEREEGCSERAGSERLPLEEAGLMPREAGEAAPPPHEKPAVAVAAVGEAETGGGAPDASREGVPGRLAALTAVELEPGLPSCEQELPSCEQDLPSAAAAAARSRAARAAWRCLTPRATPAARRHLAGRGAEGAARRCLSPETFCELPTSSRSRRRCEKRVAEATRLAAVSAAELRKSVSNQWYRKAKPSPPTADSIPPRCRDGRDARTSSTLEKK